MLHRPLHAAAYLLSPEFWQDKDAHRQDEIIRGFDESMMRIVTTKEERTMIRHQLLSFRTVRNEWSRPAIQEAATTMNAYEFWELCGAHAPELQMFALKVVSLATTSAAAERNWSQYGFIHDKLRNRLTPER